jgi:hypothetical protein
MPADFSDPIRGIRRLRCGECPYATPEIFRTLSP